MDYSKWDNVDVSEDDEQPETQKEELEPLLESVKTNAQHDLDEMVATRFLHHQDRHPDAVPKKHRELTARFIAVTDRRGQSSNTFRYADIVRFSARVRVNAHQSHVPTAYVRRTARARRIDAIFLCVYSVLAHPQSHPTFVHAVQRRAAHPCNGRCPVRAAQGDGGTQQRPKGHEGFNR